MSFGPLNYPVDKNYREIYKTGVYKDTLYAPV